MGDERKEGEEQPRKKRRRGWDPEPAAPPAEVPQDFPRVTGNFVVHPGHKWKQFQVPTEVCGPMIGKQGSNIATLRAQTMCNIDVEKPVPGRSQLYVCISNADQTLVDNAYSRVMDFVRQQLDVDSTKVMRGSGKQDGTVATGKDSGYKGTICTNMLHGSCAKGRMCPFAHSDLECKFFRGMDVGGYVFAVSRAAASMVIGKSGQTFHKMKDDHMRCFIRVDDGKLRMCGPVAEELDHLWEEVCKVMEGFEYTVERGPGGKSGVVHFAGSTHVGFKGPGAGGTLALSDLAPGSQEYILRTPGATGKLIGKGGEKIRELKETFSSCQILIDGDKNETRMLGPSPDVEALFKICLELMGSVEYTIVQAPAGCPTGVQNEGSRGWGKKGDLAPTGFEKGPKGGGKGYEKGYEKGYGKGGKDMDQFGGPPHPGYAGYGKGKGPPNDQYGAVAPYQGPPGTPVDVPGANSYPPQGYQQPPPYQQPQQGYEQPPQGYPQQPPPGYPQQPPQGYPQQPPQGYPQQSPPMGGNVIWAPPQQAGAYTNPQAQFNPPPTNDGVPYVPM